jgi:hypothetical protein
MIESAIMCDNVDATPAIEVGPGCVRRDLASAAGWRAWVIDMAPGSQWPWLDVHSGVEHVFVVRGDLTEGDRVFRAGAYLVFAPGSSHRPRTVDGVRLFGLNLAATDEARR